AVRTRLHGPGAGSPAAPPRRMAVENDEYKGEARVCLAPSLQSEVARKHAARIGPGGMCSGDKATLRFACRQSGVYAPKSFQAFAVPAMRVRTGRVESVVVRPAPHESRP